MGRGFGESKVVTVQVFIHDLPRSITERSKKIYEESGYVLVDTSVCYLGDGDVLAILIFRGPWDLV